MGCIYHIIDGINITHYADLEHRMSDEEFQAINDQIVRGITEARMHNDTGSLTGDLSNYDVEYDFKRGLLSAVSKKGAFHAENEFGSREYSACILADIPREQRNAFLMRVARKKVAELKALREEKLKDPEWTTFDPEFGYPIDSLNEEIKSYTYTPVHFTYERLAVF